MGQLRLHVFQVTQHCDLLSCELNSEHTAASTAIGSISAWMISSNDRPTISAEPMVMARRREGLTWRWRTPHTSQAAAIEICTPMLLARNNRLAAANFLFSIKNLCLLDLSINNLESFEDLAMLSVSTRLHTLTLIGNPLYTRPGYKTSIPELFPRLIYLDPEDITIHSKYQQIGFCTEEKESSSHQKKDKKPEITLPLSNSFHNRSLNLSTDSTPMLVPSSQNQSFVSQKISTPKSVKNIEKKHNRSRSQVANGSLRTTPSLNNSCKISSHSRSRSIASKNHTATSKSKTFGNPVAAMMIGPPAVTNIFKVPQRQTKSVLIDISKMKVNKK